MVMFKLGMMEKIDYSVGGEVDSSYIIGITIYDKG